MASSVKEIYHGTLSERQAFVDARRARARDHDASRLEYDRAPSSVTIERAAGYAVAAPGSLPGLEDVVGAANAVIDGIGHDAIVGGRMKGGFMAGKLLPNDDVTLDSPYLRFALNEDVVRGVAQYLDVIPILNAVDIWYSIAGPDAVPRASQMWHLDHADTTQVKIFVNLNDVRPEMGPLTIIDATTSARLASRPEYNFGKGNRVPDAEIEELIASDQLVSFEGPAGAAAFVDTSRCFHFGSRVEPGAPPRRIAIFQYLTPFAFDYPDDPSGHASYSGLAAGASTELERLVLGA